MPSIRLHWGCFHLLTILLLPVCLVAQQQRGEGSAKSPEPERQQAPELSQGAFPAFEFHSGFWVNLHHFLYQQARARRTPAVPETGETTAPAQAARPALA